MKVSMSATGAADGFIPPPFGKLMKGLWYEENHWWRFKGVERYIMYPEDSYVGYFLKYDPEWRSGDYGWVFNIYTNQPYVCSGVKLATLEQAELCSEVLKNELAKKERKKK